MHSTLLHSTALRSTPLHTNRRFRYEPTKEDKKVYKKQQHSSSASGGGGSSADGDNNNNKPKATHRFWERVEAAFAAIDRNSDGTVTRAELAAHFGGNTAEADYYIDEMDGFIGGEEEVEAPDGVVSLVEWYVGWLVGVCVRACVRACTCPRGVGWWAGLGS